MLLYVINLLISQLGRLRLSYIIDAQDIFIGTLMVYVAYFTSEEFKNYEVNKGWRESSYPKGSEYIFNFYYGLSQGQIPFFISHGIVKIKYKVGFYILAILVQEVSLNTGSI